MYFSILFNDESRVEGNISKLIVDGREVKLTGIPPDRIKVRRIFSLGKHHITIHTRLAKIEFQSTDISGFNI